MIKIHDAAYKHTPPLRKKKTSAMDTLPRGASSGVQDLLFDDSRSNNMSKHEIDSEGMDTARDKTEEKPLDKILKLKANVKRSSNRVTDV